MDNKEDDGEGGMGMVFLSEKGVLPNVGTALGSSEVVEREMEKAFPIEPNTPDNLTRYLLLQCAIYHPAHIIDIPLESR